MGVYVTLDRGTYVRKTPRGGRSPPVGALCSQRAEVGRYHHHLGVGTLYERGLLEWKEKSQGATLACLHVHEVHEVHGYRRRAIPEHSSSC